ncbi:MAG TPA: nitroreductase [Terricaulis sp.]|nr:nitroreductase [Terricaulis sp.]
MTLTAANIPAAPRDNEAAISARESAETLALMAQRRSAKVAHLIEPAPTGADLDALIHLAARVPDHGKLGPWRFVVIEGDARARAGAVLARAVENDPNIDAGRVEAARGLFLRAPACVMVVSAPQPNPKVPEWEQVLSSGAACFALLLGAHAMGYAGCWLTEWPAFNANARAALGLKEEERIAGFVYLGTTREPALERVRADAASRISRF